MQPNEAPRVSIIVPCRNEIRCIRAFLDAVFSQELDQIDMEVLIADGMSDDGTRSILREFEGRHAALRVLDNPGKIVSTGLNRAIREAKGEIIIRMDVHSVYAQNYVRSCVEVLNETNAENVGGPARTLADGHLPQAIAHAFHTPFASGGARFRNPCYEGPVDTVTYGCWRKSTLERVGMFDEQLVRSQDDELNLRITASGGVVWQSSRIISWYRPRSSLVALFLQYFQYGFWKVAVIRKHRRFSRWRNLVPVSCLLVGIILPLCAVAADLSGSAWWRNAFLAEWLTLVSLYFVASFMTAISVAMKEGWVFLLSMPIVFATYHLAYALGFLLALFYRTAAWDRLSPMRKVLTAITH
ncbi:MAG TPA: glycosyltransferase family 2 protein [Candidatus Acidoferrales bacterium]|nr:glycosyltransferase family 2 protein [Candidatus Acidoferrales bacterium]